MAKIRVIIKRPDEKIGHVCNISHTLKNLQNIVEGYIEVIAIEGNTVLLCNEEGKLKSLAHNFKMPYDTIVGTVIVCNVKGEDFADLPEGYIKTWKKLLQEWGNPI
jgi:hypothetical protein